MESHRRTNMRQGQTDQPTNQPTPQTPTRHGPRLSQRRIPGVARGQVPERGRRLARGVPPPLGSVPQPPAADRTRGRRALPARRMARGGGSGCIGIGAVGGSQPQRDWRW